jgi:hypothetical protein
MRAMKMRKSTRCVVVALVISSTPVLSATRRVVVVLITGHDIIEELFF